MPFRAIIFDVDGTLAETEEAHRGAFNQAFAEAGLDWHWSEDEYRDLLTTTGGRERIARFMINRGLDPDSDQIATLHRSKNHLYAELVATAAIVPRPGVVRLIAQATQQGILLAIATTTSRANLAALLDHAFGADAKDCFAAIVAGEDVVAKKPDPEVYRRALSALSLDAADCVAIEDSRHGLSAARGCGIATVVTPSHYTASENFADAALVCDTLESVDVARLQSLLPVRQTRGG